MIAEFGDAAVWNVWALSMLAAVLVIVVVVLLLFGITRSALQIDQTLDDVVMVAGKIIANTDPLTELEKTAALGGALLTCVLGIEADGAAVLQCAATAGGSVRAAA